MNAAMTIGPDATLRMPASTFTQLLYQRIGPLTAVRRGLRIVGGRRPWVALKLMAYFEPAAQSSSTVAKALTSAKRRGRTPGDHRDKLMKRLLDCDR